MTNGDIQNAKLTAAKERMGKEVGGLAKHSVECKRNIDWENTCKLGGEDRLRPRKVREGIESLRTNLLLRPLLDKYFDRDNVNTQARLF